MTSRDEFDVVMREWFESNALVGEPHGIHESAIRRARATRQRPRLMANPHGGYPVTRTGTVLRRRHLLAMAAALVGAALAWSLFSAGSVPDRDGPTSSPTASSPTANADRTQWFGLPFEFVIPGESGLTVTTNHRFTSLVAWVDSHVTSTEVNDYAGQAEQGSARGIVVAYGEKAWSHGDGR